MATVELESDGKMSNTAYHQTGKPTWWAYYKDSNNSTVWLELPKVRGDQKLRANVTVPDDFVGIIYYGVGKAGAKGSIREKVEIE